MKADVETPEIPADDFARRFALRAPNLMWLLGAGTSASAGIPTAGDMIWEFKQCLFVSQRRVSPHAVADLSNEAVRDQLQSHIDALGNMPPRGAVDEYAVLFEAVYPAEADRRIYVDSRIGGAKPSYGHLALATLMRANMARLIWTTNFDPLVADACARVYGGTGALATIALEAPDLAAQLLAESRWPLEIKLHGDFRSRRLKNTGEELRHQDSRLRGLLVDSCRRFGLVVVGYSGRDDSVMEALEDSLNRPGAFPAGLFWLHRGEEPPLPRVAQLLARASSVGVETALVPVMSFDEALRDLIRLVENIDAKELDAFALERRRWSPAPRSAGQRGWPVVRLNALPVEQMPTVCRRVVCEIGGVTEVREAVDAAGVNVLATRVSCGVLAYGSDADVRKALTPRLITEFDLHTIETKRLRYESAERGLLRDALARALARRFRLDHVRRRSTDLLAPVTPNDASWHPLARLVGTLNGTVGGCAELTWREGVGTRLDWADDRLWLLVEPRLVFDGLTEGNKNAAADFARERTVKRYNRQLNDLIGFWAFLLAGGDGDLRALGISDGVDAVFRLSPNTCYSQRAGA